MIHRFDDGAAPEFAAVHPDFRSDAEQLHPLVQVHDPASEDVVQARRLADEFVNVSGAVVRIYARTDSDDYDRVWDEDPDPTYWNQAQLKAFFSPQPLEVQLKKWGAQLTSALKVVFSHRQLHALLGPRMLRAGDVLRVPFNAANLQPETYRVTNGAPTGNYRYTWLYFSCDVQLLTADVTVRPDGLLPPGDVEQAGGGRYPGSL